MIGLNIYPKSNNHNNNINIIKVLANLKNKKSYALYLHLEPKDLIFLSYLHIVFLLKNIKVIINKTIKNNMKICLQVCSTYKLNEECVFRRIYKLLKLECKLRVGSYAWKNRKGIAKDISKNYIYVK